MKTTAATRPIDSLFKPGPSKPTATKLKLAELRLAAHVAAHSSLCTADHLTPVLTSMFQDSSIAAGMTLGRTKCTTLVTKVLGPTFLEMLLEDIGQQPYSLILDETSVMCGKNNSVYTMMKEENPKLILAKCTCHSLHLACSEATAYCNRIDKVNRLFQSENPNPAKLFEDLDLLCSIARFRAPIKLLDSCLHPALESHERLQLPNRDQAFPDD
ncbi:hypothetical protein HPB47_013701 [Ixodes persulcatus]|uniref:Uncharacterized protein n=1 Tax=Ixodes persulcatus TaxID=34615 RepID=A0AC60R0M2_IXOPE|nr:hypothetical protein HPB47_013701 [Ixodes persulcatus]